MTVDIGGAGCNMGHVRVLPVWNREANLASWFVFKASLTSWPQGPYYPVKSLLAVTVWLSVLKFLGSSVLRHCLCLPRKPFSSLRSNGRQSTEGSSSTSKQSLTLSLCSHEGPVWQVAWAHPMYGNILASCSYDRKVIIWKEENGTWEKTHEHTGHDSSGTLSVAGESGWGGPWMRMTSVLPNALVLSPLQCFLFVPWALVGFSASLSTEELRPQDLKPVQSKMRKVETIQFCFFKIYSF